MMIGLLQQTRRGLAVAAIAAAMLPATMASLPAADRPASGSEILIERLLIRVISDAKLAYQIEAGRGRMDEDTRQIELDGPVVNIYGSDEQVRQSLRSAAGRMWPVKLTVEEKDGTEKEVSKYDWSLSGDVAFESTEGYRVRSAELNFSSAERNITSSRGVEYRMPTGRGTILSGKASQFEARVDPGSGALTGWTLAGGVELSADPEDAPEGATAGTEAGAGGEKDGSSTGKKRKKLEDRIKEELGDQKDKIEKRMKKGKRD